MGAKKIKKNARISICMMVKNEEENLERCLKSIKPLADELIVVDTGSTDRTMEIAKSFGAQIYEHPWEKDFSKHRMQSLGYATGEWVFFVDADEEIEFVKGCTPRKFREDLKSIHQDEFTAIGFRALDMQQGKVMMQFHPFKLFRRKESQLHFKRAIHNVPKYEGKRIIHPGVIIRHYGYDLSSEKMKEKRKRTIGLLLEAIAKDPTDWPSHFYLSQSYSIAGEPEKSVKHGLEYIKHENDVIAFNKTAYFTVYKSYLKMKEIEKAGKILTRGLSKYPEDIDLNFALTEYGAVRDDAFLMRKGAEAYVVAYSRMEEKQEAWMGRFTLRYTNECLCYCIYVLCMINMQDSMTHLQNFKNLLPVVSSDYKNLMLGRIKEGFTKLDVVNKTQPFLQERYEEGEQQCQQISA